VPVWFRVYNTNTRLAGFPKQNCRDFNKLAFEAFVSTW